jgi:hypothetical protein
LSRNDIGHRISCPHTPQQNWAAERKHRHIVETGLAPLHESGVPTPFWDVAFETAVYIINILPTKLLNGVS